MAGEVGIIDRETSEQLIVDKTGERPVSRASIKHDEFIDPQSEERIILNSTRAEVYVQSDRIAFNAGHAEDISKSFPDLADVAVIHQVGEQRLMSVPPEAIINYLVGHKDTSPHAIDEIAFYIAQELQQIPNPVFRVSAIEEDSKKIESLSAEIDPDEREEEEMYLREAKQLLFDSIACIPAQAKVINFLLESPAFKNFKEDYLKTYGNTTRETDDGVPTSKTHGEFLGDNLDIIGRRLREITEQREQALESDYFSSQAVA